MGTDLPFWWIGFVSFFNRMSIVRSFIVWFFLKRFSTSSKIFSPFLLAVMFRIFVSWLPCRPISSLSSQSSTSKGCVFFFSVIKMGSLIFVFSVLTSTSASPLIFIGFLFTSTKHFEVTLISFGLIFDGIIVTGEPVSTMTSIGCPSYTIYAVDGLNVIYFWPRLRIAAGIFLLYPVYGFGSAEFGKVSRLIAIVAFSFPCRADIFGCPIGLSAKMAVSFGSFLVTRKCGFSLGCGFCVSDLFVFGCTFRGISALSFCFAFFILVFRVTIV